MQPIKRRLDKIETALAGMEPERPRRHLTAQEQTELDALNQQGSPFDLPRDQFFRWKELHFIKGYGYTVAELRKTTIKGSLAQAIQKSKEMMS